MIMYSVIATIYTVECVLFSLIIYFREEQGNLYLSKFCFFDTWAWSVRKERVPNIDVYWLMTVVHHPSCTRIAVPEGEKLRKFETAVSSAQK